MENSGSCVYIVDDDELIRDSLKQLVNSVSLKVRVFSSAQSFLDYKLPNQACCLVLDIRMPGMSGLELQDELKKTGQLIPIIFITRHATVAMSVRALKAGAIDFIQKPFEDQDILDSINHAIEYNRQARVVQAEINNATKYLQTLTVREREILVPIVAGTINKEIASQFKMSESTVKTHRVRIMKKMQAESFAELVRMIEKIGLYPERN